MSDRTTVHLLRHGEVHNPTGVLYGRLEDFHLSDLGRAMAERVGEYLSGRDIAAVYASPLERAQETALPIAAAHSLDIRTNVDLIEAANVFEGQRVSVGDGVLRKPSGTCTTRSHRRGASRTSTSPGGCGRRSRQRARAHVAMRRCA